LQKFPFFVFFFKTKKLYLAQKKKETTTWLGPRAKTPFHFDRVTKNTSCFNLFFPIVG
jgi:hypothetical protein